MAGRGELERAVVEVLWDADDAVDRSCRRRRTAGPGTGRDHRPDGAVPAGGQGPGPPHAGTAGRTPTRRSPAVKNTRRCSCSRFSTPRPTATPPWPGSSAECRRRTSRRSGGHWTAGSVIDPRVRRRCRWRCFAIALIARRCRPHRTGQCPACSGAAGPAGRRDRPWCSGRRSAWQPASPSSPDWSCWPSNRWATLSSGAAWNFFAALLSGTLHLPVWRLVCGLAAAALTVVLLTVLGRTAVLTVRRRRAHRQVLDLLTGPSPKKAVDGRPVAVGGLSRMPEVRILDHRAAVAYTLPGWHSRVVLSAGLSTC